MPYCRPEESEHVYFPKQRVAERVYLGTERQRVRRSCNTEKQSSNVIYLLPAKWILSLQSFRRCITRLD